MGPDLGRGDPNHKERQPRLLVFYSSIDRAAALAQRLRGECELILCPVAVPPASWMEELEPDLILLDLPEDQSEILAACETLRSRTELPIVLLSANNGELFVARALGCGIDEYLAEPMGDRELVARLDALLRRLRRNQRPKDLLQLGDLALSTLDHTVERHGRKIPLSPIEFRLLYSLALAPGSILTHQTLMARVWGAEYVDSRHYLRLYIRYLREKLEDDPTSPKLLLSEWGVGYRLQPQTAGRAPNQARPKPARGLRPPST